MTYLILRLSALVARSRIRMPCLREKGIPQSESSALSTKTWRPRAHSTYPSRWPLVIGSHFRPQAKRSCEYQAPEAPVAIVSRESTQLWIEFRFGFRRQLRVVMRVMRRSNATRHLWLRSRPDTKPVMASVRPPGISTLTQPRPVAKAAPATTPKPLSRASATVPSEIADVVLCS